MQWRRRRSSPVLRISFAGRARWRAWSSARDHGATAAGVLLARRAGRLLPARASPERDPAALRRGLGHRLFPRSRRSPARALARAAERGDAAGAPALRGGRHRGDRPARAALAAPGDRARAPRAGFGRGDTSALWAAHAIGAGAVGTGGCRETARRARL